MLLREERLCGASAVASNFRAGLAFEPEGPALVDRLQLFPRLEPYCSSRRNRNFGSGARITANPRLAWPHIEDPESPQFNAISGSQRLLHALKYRFHSQFGFGLGDASFRHDFIDDIEFNHAG